MPKPIDSSSIRGPQLEKLQQLSQAEKKAETEEAKEIRLSHGTFKLGPTKGNFLRRKVQKVITPKAYLAFQKTATSRQREAAFDAIDGKDKDKLFPSKDIKKRTVQASHAYNFLTVPETKAELKSRILSGAYNDSNGLELFNRDKECTSYEERKELLSELKEQVKSASSTRTRIGATKIYAELNKYSKYEGLRQITAERLASQEKVPQASRPKGKKEFKGTPDELFRSTRHRYAGQSVAAIPVETAIRLPTTGTEPELRLCANKVQLAKGEPVTIATQAPLPAAQGDFWLANLENNVTAVVDLTRRDELEKQGNKDPKVHKYYPDADEPSRTFESGGKTITVNFQSSAPLPENAGIIVNKYMISDGSGEPRKITRFHFQEWVDHSGAHPKDLDQLIDAVDKYAQDKTVTVHCSAGVGRTGTFITARTAKHQLAGQRLDIPEMEAKLGGLILKGREQRNASFVQTDKQWATLMTYTAGLVDAPPVTKPAVKAKRKATRANQQGKPAVPSKAETKATPKRYKAPSEATKNPDYENVSFNSQRPGANPAPKPRPRPPVQAKPAAGTQPARNQQTAPPRYSSDWFNEQWSKGAYTNDERGEMKLWQDLLNIYDPGVFNEIREFVGMEESRHPMARDWDYITKLINTAEERLHNKPDKMDEPIYQNPGIRTRQ